MIRVTAAPEPAGFDANVRQPGLSAIAELVGEAPTLRRPGPPRKAVAAKREELDSEHYPPFWTKALPDLLESYHRICAYTCLYIEQVTGAPSVDHMLPKSRAWHQVYEWTNYRLACALMNARKGAVRDVLDPFAVQDGWFALELVGFQVVPGEGVSGDTSEQVVRTIDRLRLNDADCLKMRQDYALAYVEGDISLAYLARRAPFVARELQRQGKL